MSANKPFPNTLLTGRKKKKKHFFMFVHFCYKETRGHWNFPGYWLSCIKQLYFDGTFPNKCSSMCFSGKNEQLTLGLKITNKIQKCIITISFKS